MEEKIFEKDFSYRARVNGKDGVITVRPEEKGKPTKKDVVQVGKAQMWSTTGKRNPRRFVQLEASEKTGDLIGEMKEQFDGIIAELGGTPSPDPMERPLTTQDKRLEVWLSKERHQLVVKKTVNLNETPDYGTEISTLVLLISKHLLSSASRLLISVP